MNTSFGLLHSFAAAVILLLRMGVRCDQVVKYLLEVTDTKCRFEPVL